MGQRSVFALDPKVFVTHADVEFRGRSGHAESDGEARVSLLVLLDDARNVDR